MGSIRKIASALLIGLAFAAFHSDASAQTRRASSDSQRSSGNSVSRSSNQNTRKSSSTPPSTVRRPAERTVNSSKYKPGNQDKPAQVARQSSRKPSSNQISSRPSVRPGQSPSRPVTQVRPDHRPDRHRVHPRERDFMRWNKPSYFWSGHNHYYGYRVKSLPARVVRHKYYGHTYYCYKNIWYRPYGSCYVVCRPPYGVSLAADIISDIAWTAVRLSYYNTVANTYNQINANNAYIAEQNAIIAQNNATIASQNSIIAQTQPMAYASYTLANSLGLVQSYAAAGADYFYQDGVFYSIDSSGQYRVIIPPAGALVDVLPDDYDIVTLNDGKQYYRVDDTVYRVVISDGRPTFEVLGQLY